MPNQRAIVKISPSFMGANFAAPLSIKSIFSPSTASHLKASKSSFATKIASLNFASRALVKCFNAISPPKLSAKLARCSSRRRSCGSIIAKLNLSSAAAPPSVKMACAISQSSRPSCEPISTIAILALFCGFSASETSKFGSPGLAAKFCAASQAARGNPPRSPPKT